LFHARGPAAANDRSPSDDLVHGTATVLDAADLKPVLTVAAADFCSPCCSDGNLSESEVELDGEHNEVTLPQDLPGRGNTKSAKSAIR